MGKVVGKFYTRTRQHVFRLPVLRFREQLTDLHKCFVKL